LNKYFVNNLIIYLINLCARYNSCAKTFCLFFYLNFIFEFYFLDKREKQKMVPSLYTVKAIIILDNDGHRLVGKYYDDQFSTIKEQKEFEKNLFSKTAKQNGEIIMLENLTIVYKNNLDVFYYVVGSTSKNTIFLAYNHISN
jgi:hypothetical protein